MAKISACIISLNEEKKIEDCLKSLQGIVDEIIIVDSNSTDDTLNIAKKYTDKVFIHDFEGYGKQKNWASAKATHDWIISLDCDERLSEELQDSILAIKDKLDNGAVYTMPIKTFYVYRWLNHCWYPDRKKRLFNRTTTQWLENNVHESVDDSNLKILKLNGDILHYSFDSISQHLKTIDTYTQIGADDLIKKGKRITVISPITHASWTFFKLYFIQRGFMDGFAGLVVSALSYFHVFIKYSKAYIQTRQNNSK